jgi:hypothetical protein
LSAFLFLAAALASAQPALPSDAAVEQAVEKLDMTSFPNSLASEGAPGRRALRQFGGQAFAWEEGSLFVTETGGGWSRSFKPLPSKRGRIRLCFAEQALGGTYLTQEAIELRPGEGGLYAARTIKHRACERYAR